jgi:two-component system response regulator (stage 0 sporulation protein F)
MLIFDAEDTMARNPEDVTILVVDDEELLREAIAYEFQRKGFCVLEATSGNKAIEILKDRSVDVVVSDVRMPDGDGIRLLDYINTIQDKPPALMLLTGFADISTEDALKRGAFSVMSKPFDRKSLVNEVIQNILSRDR